jgi:hypothetical protein
VSQQPIQAKPADQREDVFCPRVRHFFLNVGEQIKVFIIFIDPTFPFA